MVYERCEVLSKDPTVRRPVRVGVLTLGTSNAIIHNSNLNYDLLFTHYSCLQISLLTLSE
jgi:hypothetical protein